MTSGISHAAPAVAGVGIYSLPEAARLVQMPANTLRRWLQGYRFPAKWSEGASEPIFEPQLPAIEGHLALGFLDLVEVLFIRAFREKGVSLPVIRRAAEKAAQLWHTDHPFSVKRLKTDGRSVFADLESESGPEGLMDLAKSQFAFESVIQPYLMQVDYDAETAARWWPLGKSKHVLVDPRFSFGRPVVDTGKVPTSAIYSAFLAQQSEREIAKWFDIPLASVRAAVQFEKSRAA